MFLIFNKDKIVSFLVAATTVVALFMMTSFFAKVPDSTMETVSTKRQFREEEFNSVNKIQNDVEISE